MAHNIVLDSMSLDNDVFRTYVFWVGVLAIKMLLMAPLTARFRFQKGVFANSEDTKLTPKSKVKFDDPDVERVRRAHRNDLENIFIFFTIGYFYILTKPDATLAKNLFRLVGISRVIHTIVYAVYVLPQPARALAWFVPFLTTFYMAYECVRSFY